MLQSEAKFFQISRDEQNKGTPGNGWALADSDLAGLPPERLGSRGIGVHSRCKTALNSAIQNEDQLHEARQLVGDADVRTTELFFGRKEQDSERAALPAVELA